jgi:hypothetical protein
LILELTKPELKMVDKYTSIELGGTYFDSIAPHFDSLFQGVAANRDTAAASEAR